SSWRRSLISFFTFASIIALRHFLGGCISPLSNSIHNSSSSLSSTTTTPSSNKWLSTGSSVRFFSHCTALARISSVRFEPTLGWFSPEASTTPKVSTHLITRSRLVSSARLKAWLTLQARCILKASSGVEAISMPLGTAAENWSCVS
ncbi:putative transmembrane protein, partial [Gregarina niphandrodes]